MAEDEAATIRRLTDYREQISVLVRQNRGRVVDSPGDNILAEFPTALDAVRCAVEMQGVLRARNASLLAERRMEFRIGVHMGDVAVEGERVYGDGVNIAARLEGLAEAGGVCISATVHEQVRNRVDVGFTDLGDQTVKNIPEQVHVYRIQPRDPGAAAPPEASAPAPRSSSARTALGALAAVVLVLGLGLWATWPRPLGLVLDLAGVSAAPVNPALPDKPSLVVLPFANMSAEPEQEHFSDGITEELTANLSHLPFLFVISRNTAFSFKGQAIRVEEIGRELGVRYVVEGSVRRAGDRVRITAQLIDASTGLHLWSDHYDRELADIFAVQSEISESILAAVGVEVQAAEVALIRRRPTDDLTAYESYTRAYSKFFKMTRAGHAEAQELLERAIKLDPDYADAYALLGQIHSSTYAFGWSLDGSLVDRAAELAENALELDPSSAGHTVLASVSLARGRPEQAIVHAERAIEVAPSVPAGYAFRAVGLAVAGRPVAATQAIRQAMRLDPRLHTNPVLWGILAELNWATGRREEAVRLWEQAREANTDLLLPRLSLADYHASEGHVDDVRTLVEEIRRVTPEMTAEAAVEVVSRTGSGGVSPSLAESLREAGLR